MPSVFVVPADGICSLWKRDFGTFPPADAHQNYTGFGHTKKGSSCPLLGVKRTSPSALHMSAYDPKRTLTPGQNVLTTLFQSARLLDHVVLGFGE